MALWKNPVYIIRRHCSTVPTGKRVRSALAPRRSLSRRGTAARRLSAWIPISPPSRTRSDWVIDGMSKHASVKTSTLMPGTRPTGVGSRTQCRPGSTCFRHRLFASATPAVAFSEYPPIAGSDGAVAVQIEARVISRISPAQSVLCDELQKVGEPHGTVAIEVGGKGLQCDA